MPGIVVFRRRWMVASDDFVIPFSIAFVIRGIWFLVLAVSLTLCHAMGHVHYNSPENQHQCQQTVDYYIGGYLALLFATNIMELSIAWMSGKGSIMDTEPRSLIPALLYVRLMLLIIEVVWLSIGIKWVWLDTDNCGKSDEIIIAQAIVIFNWMFLFVVAIIIYCTFDTAGQAWFELQQARTTGYCVDSADGPSYKYKLHITQKYERRWQGCFRYAFCCRSEGQGDENVYAFIGRTLSEYFQDLDVVPSDFASGLVLLRRHQKYQEQLELEKALEERRIQETTTDGVPLKKSSLRYQRTNNARLLRLNYREELLTYKEITYYMNYALAAYGWPIFMKNNIGCGCCKLMKSFRCCYCCRSYDKRVHKVVHVDEDNCCRCHFSALKTIAGLHNSDVIYCSYHNDMYKSPFYVALDHTKKTVVVVIRGTLSLQDILTDFSVEPERIPVEDGDSSWFGHKGMVRCAVYIQNKLVNEGILQKAFYSDPDCGTPNYRLIVLGHSLGAGTAAILAFLLRPRYPDLFCYAYSPPGANLSLSAAQYAKEFVISIVVGKDMIPRLSLFTLEDLRNNIMTLITKSGMSKWRILRGCACRCAFVCCYGCKCVKFDDQKDELDAEIENIEMPEITHSSSMRFYPPGRILHIVKTCSVNYGCGRTETMYEPVWAGLDEFQSIKISGLMWKDHMPDFVLEALNKCLPSKEEQEAVLNGPDTPHPAVLEVPATPDWYCKPRSSPQSMGDSFFDEFSVEFPSVRVHHPAEVVSKNLSNSGSKDSLSIETRRGQKEIFPLYARTSESPRVPLARPESSFDDSDLEESATSSRISATWKDFNLPVVEQSFNSLSFSRSQSNCDNPISPIAVQSLCTTPTTFDTSRQINKVFSIPNLPSSKYLDMTKAPPKPPRTFASENSGEWVLDGTSNSVSGTSPNFSSAVVGNSSEVNGAVTLVNESSRNPSTFVGLKLGINGTSQPVWTRSPLGPPKPPRTFEYVMVDSASYSYDLNCLSSPDECLIPPNEIENNGKSSSIVCKSFVDNSNPIKVTTDTCVSHSSTVTHLQDKSCLMLCNGFYAPKSANGMLQKSASYKSSNSYSRCFSEEKISINKLNRKGNKFEQKSFTLGRNTDLKRGFNSEEISIAEQKVVIRRSRGNRNKSKRQAMYWDEDETSRLLQFSSSCSDIPDTSILQKTKELDNGVLETWL